jgi:hypothetical protein
MKPGRKAKSALDRALQAWGGMDEQDRHVFQCVVKIVAAHKEADKRNRVLPDDLVPILAESIEMVNRKKGLA